MDKSLIGRPTVCVVDDDAAVRRALAFTLDLEGFQVETYASGEALLLRDPLAGPACLVIDERLPGVSGLETLRQLRNRHVELPAVLVTSHPQPAFRAAAAAAGVPILEKPLMDEALVATIQQLLQGGPELIA
jgi:FixJ family two-component response regulator